MTDNDPVTLEHSILVRCLGVSTKPSRHPARTERIFSIVLAEVDPLAQGLVGHAVLRDVPHEMAKRLAEGLSRNLKYRLAFSLEEQPDEQRDMFRPSKDDHLPVDLDKSSVSSVTISSPGLGSVTLPPDGLEKAAKIARAARTGKTTGSPALDRAVGQVRDFVDAALDRSPIERARARRRGQ